MEPDDFDNYGGGHDEDDYEDDNRLDVQQTKQQEKGCKVLSEAQVSLEMDTVIKDISSLLALRPTITRILLNRLKGDQERLCEQFFDRRRREKFFRDAQIADPASIRKNPVPVHLTQITCEICYADYNINNCLSADCGHYFCKLCWEAYLVDKIADEGLSYCITCPQYQCCVAVDDESVESLISQPKVRARFRKGLLDAYVLCNACMRPCPKPDCGHVIEMKEPAMMRVRCICEYEFCFNCGGNWHSPITCDLLKKWNRKNLDGKQSNQWIYVNTKNCPKCDTAIEKNGGCNYMTCGNGTCRFEFCWVCFEGWENYGPHNCVPYSQEETWKENDSKEEIRQELNRYAFYFQRYSSHSQSLRFENKLKFSMKDTMDKLKSKQNFYWNDVQFIFDAVDVLCNCRKTLKYTYAFLFYLERDNEAKIFEDNQQNLQDATEMLSRLLNNFADLVDTGDLIVNYSQRIKDKYQYCEARRKVIEDHVKEGNDGNRWKFQNF